MSDFILPLGVFTVALLYSSVGHGGASGYLAIMSFAGVPVEQMATTALMLNLMVAAIALSAYWRAGHLSWWLTWPFILGSVPAAFAGGLVNLPTATYELVLSMVLLLAAVRLLWSPKVAGDDARPLSLPVAVATGAVLGLVSGMVGIGGGVFLSPLIILMNWADPKRTSATSACFILTNSVAGLGGRALRQGLDVGHLLPLVIAAFVGGILGSCTGANRVSGLWLRRLLAVVLMVAACRLVIIGR